MPTVDIKRAGTDLQRRVAPNKQEFVQTEDLSYLDAVQEQAAKWKQAEDLNYVANSTTELQKQIHETSKQLEQEFFNNPEGYTQAHEQATAGLYKAAIDNAPSSEARNQMLVQAEQTKRFNLNNALAWEQTNTVARYQERHDAAITDITNMLADTPNERQYQEMRALMEAENLAAEQHLSPAAHVELVKRNQRALDNTYITSLAQSSPSAARELLNSGRFDEVFEASEQQKLNNAIDSKEESLIAKNKAEVSAARTRNKEQKEFTLARNPNDLGVISALVEETLSDVESEKLSVGQATALLNKLNAAYEKAGKKQGEYRAVAAAIESGIPVSKDNQKAVDTYYAEKILTEPPMEGEEEYDRRVRVTNEVLKATGRLPETVTSMYKGALFSPESKRAVEGAMGIISAIDTHENAANQFTDKEKSRAVAIKNFVQAGTPPEQAIDMIQKQTATSNVAEFEYKRSVWSGSRKEVNEAINTYVSKLDNRITFSEVDAPTELPPGMMADIMFLAESNFTSDGHPTIESAVEASIFQVMSVWRRTDVFGKDRYMKYAPEINHSVAGVSSSWMQDDLFTQLKEFSGAEAVETKYINLLPGISVPVEGTAEDSPVLNSIVRVMPVDESGNSYWFMTRNPDNGQLETIHNDSGEVFFWEPNWENTPEGKEASEMFRKEVKEAEAMATRHRDRANLEISRDKFKKLLREAKKAGVIDE